ncbi:MAG TPA: CpsB/CapC family capsule biosynthesis tyrosine phosphatase [Solirubrobacteraceae bacterium]|jgi:protein-tyrosine phosphatase
MIDLHCHALPGIDDGPDSIEGSLALARAAAEAGTGTLVATPHVSSRYPNDAATIELLVEQLAERIAGEQIELTLLAGAEIAVTYLVEIDPSHLGRLGLGGGPWLLVEPPFTAVVSGIDAIIRDLLRRGHRVLLAHPERCPAFRRDPRMLESLVAEGILTSITAGSLTGRFGGEVRRFSLALLEAELVHNVASDAHDHRNRPPSIAEELEAAGAGPLQEWLTEEVPAAILTGGEIPRRPDLALTGSRPRRWSWRRR